MELKKNPKADLNRNIGMYFSIGLAVVTGLCWWGIEFKTYDEVKKLDYTMDVQQDLEEDVPIAITMATPPPPPPPPPPPAPEIIEVVEDDEEVEEVEIQSTETTKEEVIKDVQEFQEVEEEEVVVADVPFTVIEDKPLFPGCEKKKTKQEQEICFKEKLDDHVRKTFHYPEVAQEMGIQGRVYVNFRINKDGTITVLGTRGPDKNLEKEAKRIIESLPKLVPGKQRGKPTPVTFAYPIVFKLN